MQIRVIHLISKIEKIDQELQELQDIKKSLRSDRSYCQRIYQSLESERAGLQSLRKMVCSQVIKSPLPPHLEALVEKQGEKRGLEKGPAPKERAPQQAPEPTVWLPPDRDALARQGSKKGVLKETAAGGVERAGEAEKAERIEKAEKAERIEKAEKIEKIEKAEGAKRSYRNSVERVEMIGDKAAQQARINRVNRINAEQTVGQTEAQISELEQEIAPEEASLPQKVEAIKMEAISENKKKDFPFTFEGI